MIAIAVASWCIAGLACHEQAFRPLSVCKPYHIAGQFPDKEGHMQTGTVTVKCGKEKK